MTEQTNTPTRSEADLIEDLYDQFLQIDKYSTIIKEIKAQAKSFGYDGALLAKVAQAKVNDNVESLTEKTEHLLELLGEV